MNEIKYCINPECKLSFGNEDKFKKGLCSLCFYAIANCKDCNDIQKCNNKYSKCIKVQEFINKLKKIKKLDDFL